MLAFATQLIQATKDQIYQTALDIGEGLGLPVTSWATGDPTRSLYHVLAETFATAESVAVELVGSAFLDYATGDWLTLVAKQVYDVDRVAATYATTTATLTNNGGGLYDGLIAGDITVEDTSTGATFHSTSGGTLASWSGSGPKPTLDITVVADLSGSAGSAGATEIDALVTGLPGVTCSNAVAAVGIDAESDSDLRARCRLKLSALSDKGPKGIYDYIARTPALSGTTEITRSRTVGDSDTGNVVLYVAGPSGAVSAGAITAVTDAINRLAAALNDTPAVVNSSNVTVAVTYEIWLYASLGKTDTEIKAAILSALEAVFEVRPIGGDSVTPGAAGKLYKSLVETTIGDAFKAKMFQLSVTAPAGDTSLTLTSSAADVAALGTVTGTVHLISDP